MKVIALNGSPRKEGNTYLALQQAGKIFEEEGVDFEIFQVGKGPTRDCVACGTCVEKGCCVFNDDGVNEFVAKAKDADGLLLGTPVYYAHPSGHVLSFLDRAFYSGGKNFACKVGASFAVARRAGTCASFDVMNKYFGITKMIIAGSSYWNVGFGRQEGDILQDKEGLQTIENLAKNMVYIMKCLEAGKKAGIEQPKFASGNMMNFIR